MVTLIFGAGASFGSGNCYPTNPPLGNDLFNELVKLDGAFSRLDKKMKNEFKKKGFEMDGQLLMVRRVVECQPTEQPFSQEAARAQEASQPR